MLEKDVVFRDLLCKSPPCQGFSIAGKRDVLDPRNNLINVFIEYVQYFKPDVFCMENVYGILSMKFKNGQPVVDTIISSLQEYNISVNKLSAQWFEVPQNRKRVIIVGFRIQQTLLHPILNHITIQSFL